MQPPPLFKIEKFQAHPAGNLSGEEEKSDKIFSFYLDKWQRSSDKYKNAKRRLRSSEQSKSKRNKKNTNIRIIIKNLFFFDTVVCYTCLHIFSLISEVSSIFIRSCIEIVLGVTPKETSLCDSIIEINCWLLTANG